MKIYKIEMDSNNINILSPTDSNKMDVDFLTFDAEPRSQGWEELEVYIQNPKMKAKKFSNLGSGILVCDQIAFDLLETLFEMSGEILSLKLERSDKKLHLINILECLNCLDYKKTEWDMYDDGTKGRILKYSFLKERVGSESTLFKIPETSKIYIFTITGLKNPSDEFFSLYHKHKLTGLTFELIQEW